MQKVEKANKHSFYSTTFAYIITTKNVFTTEKLAFPSNMKQKLTVLIPTITQLMLIQLSGKLSEPAILNC